MRDGFNGRGIPAEYAAANAAFTHNRRQPVVQRIRTLLERKIKRGLTELADKSKSN